MSLIKLPEIQARAPVDGVSFDVRPEALDRWTPGVHAADNAEDVPTITILDQIGIDWWTGEGVTAKRVASSLRAIGGQDVRVDINSPGGDFFEGVAIYNQLRAHSHRVTVRVLGLAASAASVIAMAGDDILMGDGAFLMIHNAWAVAVGNRHDMRGAADSLEPFDLAMAELYEARSGVSLDEIQRLMDEETWLRASDAIDRGFATGTIDGTVAVDDPQAADRKKYLSMVEASMARAGHTRAQRREALRALFNGRPGAAELSATPGAGESDIAASLQSLLSTLRT